MRKMGIFENWEVIKEIILLKLYNNHHRRINEKNGSNEIKNELNEEGKIIHDTFVIIERILLEEIKQDKNNKRK